MPSAGNHRHDETTHLRAPPRRQSRQRPEVDGPSHRRRQAPRLAERQPAQPLCQPPPPARRCRAAPLPPGVGGDRGHHRPAFPGPLRPPPDAPGPRASPPPIGGQALGRSPQRQQRSHPPRLALDPREPLRGRPGPGPVPRLDLRPDPCRPEVGLPLSHRRRGPPGGRPRQDPSPVRIRGRLRPADLPHSPHRFSPHDGHRLRRTGSTRRPSELRSSSNGPPTPSESPRRVPPCPPGPGTTSREGHPPTHRTRSQPSLPKAEGETGEHRVESNPAIHSARAIKAIAGATPRWSPESNRRTKGPNPVPAPTPTQSRRVTDGLHGQARIHSAGAIKANAARVPNLAPQPNPAPIQSRRVTDGLHGQTRIHSAGANKANAVRDPTTTPRPNPAPVQSRRVIDGLRAQASIHSAGAIKPNAARVPNPTPQPNPAPIQSRRVIDGLRAQASIHSAGAIKPNAARVPTTTPRPNPAPVQSRRVIDGLHGQAAIHSAGANKANAARVPTTTPRPSPTPVQSRRVTDGLHGQASIHSAGAIKPNAVRAPTPALRPNPTPVQSRRVTDGLHAQTPIHSAGAIKPNRPRRNVPKSAAYTPDALY